MSCRDARHRHSLPLYEAGLLDPVESRRFESHLLECPGCAQDLMDMLPVVSAIREMRSPFEEELAPLPFWLFVRRHWAAVAAAAAAVVLALTLYFHYLPQLDWRSATPPTADINHVLQEMSRHAREGYPADTDPPGIRQAAVDFQAGRFPQALDKSQLLLRQGSREPAVVLLAARCQLALGQPGPALALLADHPAGPGDPAYADQLWLQAEAYLRLRRPQEAKPLLEQLAARPGPYQASARRLLGLLSDPSAR
jgi:tetratricopeptide (TPR) repeat protein